MLDNFQKIRHFASRAGFGLSPQAYSGFRNLKYQEVIDQYFSRSIDLLPMPSYSDSAEIMQSQTAVLNKRKVNIGRTISVKLEWMNRMVESENPLEEKMSLFWHGHFACRILHPGLATQYLNVFRKFGLGKFRDLLLAIARNPAMIRYLNNQENRKSNPNENFTRELMELFTLGRGHYTELDVKEGARAFTGWSSNRQGEFVFRTFSHDYGLKEFMGQKGNFDGEDIIDIILSKKATAEFLAKKIVKYFISPSTDQVHVDLISDYLWNNDMHIGDTLHWMFCADWFYSKKYIGSKMKSPTELLVGLRKLLKIESMSRNATQYLMKGMGQVLFNPPNVAGWPGDIQWIDNATLTLRLSIPALLLNEQYQDYDKIATQFDLSEIEQTLLDNNDSSEDLAKIIFAHDRWKMNHLHQNILSNGASTLKDIKQKMVELLSTPEYQLC